MWAQPQVKGFLIGPHLYLSLSQIAHGKEKYGESLAMCETARDLYEAQGRDEYLDEIAHAYAGTALNLQELGKFRGAALAAGEG
jgi:hypothetical protein